MGPRGAGTRPHAALRPPGTLWRAPCPTFAVLEEDVPDAAARAGVHPAGGLVQNHGPRRAEEGEADGQLPLHAPRQDAGLCVLMPRQLHILQGPARRAPRSCPRTPKAFLGSVHPPGPPATGDSANRRRRRGPEATGARGPCPSHPGLRRDCANGPRRGGRRTHPGLFGENSRPPPRSIFLRDLDFHGALRGHVG